MNRRQMLTTTAAGTAAMLLPSLSHAQAYPSVQEVLFDSEIPVLGNVVGDVTIAEYFDYQCPYCKRGHDDLLDLVREDGKVRLVMKDWPIFGGASVYAASLVLAAGDDYEAGLNALMATPGRLSRDEVDEALADAGLDATALYGRFEKDRPRVDGILSRNTAQARAFGFSGTPVYIVGTKIYRGAIDRTAMIEAIAAARES